MSATGLIADLPLLDYVRDPAAAPSLSSSLAHTLLSKSPRHAFHESPRLNPDWQPEEAEYFDVGTVLHSIFLENDFSRIAVINAKDYRTQAARGARDQARHAGKVPILVGKLDLVQAMVEAIRAAVSGSEIRQTSGRPEVSLFWQEDDIWCRARPDWVSTDRRVLIDLKTTNGSAEPNAWARGPMLANGFDLQAVHAMRGIQALEKPRDVTFIFCVVEVEPPHGVSLVSLSPAFITFAEAKLASARAIWRECLERNSWPGYPPRICYAEPPAYAEMQFAEKQAVVDDGRPLAEQLMERGPR